MKMLCKNSWALFIRDIRVDGFARWRSEERELKKFLKPPRTYKLKLANNKKSKVMLAHVWRVPKMSIGIKLSRENKYWKISHFFGAKTWNNFIAIRVIFHLWIQALKVGMFLFQMFEYWSKLENFKDMQTVSWFYSGKVEAWCSWKV